MGLRADVGPPARGFYSRWFPGLPAEGEIRLASSWVLAAPGRARRIKGDVMRRMGAASIISAAVGLCWLASAQAFKTSWKVCKTGAGNAIVSPAKSGNCHAGQKPIYFAGGL